jgi:hypothetical protein
VSAMSTPRALNVIWVGRGLWSNIVTISLRLALKAAMIAKNSRSRHPARRPLGPKNQVLNSALRLGVATAGWEIKVGVPSVSGIVDLLFLFLTCTQDRCRLEAGALFYIRSRSGKV